MINNMDDQLLLFVYHILHKKYGNEGGGDGSLDHLKEQEAQKKAQLVQKENLKKYYLNQLMQAYTEQSEEQPESRALPLPAVEG